MLKGRVLRRVGWIREIKTTQGKQKVHKKLCTETIFLCTGIFPGEEGAEDREQRAEDREQRAGGRGQGKVRS